MKRKIISNLFSSGIEKISIIGIQFFSSIILIRLLPRENYGAISIVAGYFVFIAFINISFESIILRDHNKFDEKLKDVLEIFFTVNLFKSLFFIIISLFLTSILPAFYKNDGLIYAIWAMTFTIISDSIAAPLVLYFSSKFNQILVTKVSVSRYLLNLTLLFGLFKYPDLWYIALKELIVSCFFVFTWLLIANKKISFKPRIRRINIKFLFDAFFSYSLWAHLNGVITNFIYRSDVFFLSFFVSLTLLGNYSIALNSANIANVLPSILNYQNSIALSNVKGNPEKELKVTNCFLMLSFFIGGVSLLLFYFFSPFYIMIVTGENNYFIEKVLIIIVFSLVISKTFLSPIISYLSIIHSVRSVTIYIYIPAFLISVILYPTTAYLYGGYGVAYANIIISIFITFISLNIGLRKGWKFKINKEMVDVIVGNYNGKK